MHQHSNPIHESNTETTISVAAPPVVMHDNKIRSMSNIDLGMHTIPPRIITKDASYSFIWIDDHYKDLSKLSEEQHLKQEKIWTKVSKRGCCNLFTILFIISIILFLFLYPFITFYFLPSTTSTTGE